MKQHDLFAGVRMQETSLDAYRSIDLTVNERAVFNALAEIQPAMDWELAEHLGWSDNSVRPRRNALMNKGMVIKDGKGETPSGRKAYRWKIPPQPVQVEPDPPKFGEWVSVDERLPDDARTVLVVDAHTCMYQFSTYHPRPVIWTGRNLPDGVWQCEWASQVNWPVHRPNRKVYRVTHWMHLPKPPK